MIAAPAKIDSLTPPIPRKIPSLDGLRALSIGCVLIAHLIGTSGFPVREYPLLGMAGSFGVRVFFVISGFLITTLLLKEQYATGRISLRNFYTRRVLRIFPAFYAYLGVAVVLVSLGVFQIEQGDMAHAVTYTMNYHYPHGWLFAHTWSLSVEEQFYLLWPAVLAFAGPVRGIYVAGATLVVVPILRLVALQFFSIPPEYFGMQFHLTADALATGCLLAAARTWLGSRPWYVAILKSRLFPLVPLLAVALNLLHERPRILALGGYALMNLAIALTIDRTTRFPVRFLNTRPMKFFGVLSYSLYLWQQLFLNRHSGAWCCAFPQNVIFAVAAACGSYYLIEKPFLKLKDRFS